MRIELAFANSQTCNSQGPICDLANQNLPRFFYFKNVQCRFIRVMVTFFGGKADFYGESSKKLFIISAFFALNSQIDSQFTVFLFDSHSQCPTRFDSQFGKVDSRVTLLKRKSRRTSVVKRWNKPMELYNTVNTLEQTIRRNKTVTKRQSCDQCSV